jgi:hypothetical protein
LAFADGSLWTADPGSGLVTKIDPFEDKIIARAKLHPWITDLVVGGGSVVLKLLPVVAQPAHFALPTQPYRRNASRPASQERERLEGQWDRGDDI